ncbi:MULTISPECIES: ComF family protein [unclassified Blautia]|uniref:ComF family protein n=1 Tax=unclassified Blautia TaxID=2648079 RepID=UPI003F8C23F9
MLRKILDIFYPRCCPVCQKILKDQRRMICPECEKKLQPIGHPRCYKCGKPIEEGEYCKDCQKHTHIFDQGRGIFVYDGIMRRSVTRYKYYGCREYGYFYAKAMYRYAWKNLNQWKPDLIVPVPIHKSKERLRGFNQAAYLAERLSCYTGIPVDTDLVQKVVKTKSQKKLNAMQRRKNLEKAFLVTKNIRGKDILVIDDVYTTGSTIDAMAGCLRKRGAKNIYFLTVCIGRA